jgi:hypothetical protein
VEKLKKLLSVLGRNNWLSLRCRTENVDDFGIVVNFLMGIAAIFIDVSSMTCFGDNINTHQDLVNMFEEY